MAEGGSAPPVEAMRGAKGGVSAVVTIVVAVVTFLGGLGVGAFVLAPQPAAAAPSCATPGAAGVNETTLLLGTNTPFPPFESRTATGGLQGFDIDLIQEMVRRANYACEWVDFRDFTALLAAVSAGGVNIAVGAITMNGQTGANRNMTLDFTNPYFEADQGILKKTSDTRNFCAAADCTAAELDQTSYRVGVQQITTSEFYIDDNLPNVTKVALPSVSDVLLALDAGNVDFVVIDKPAADGIAAANPSRYTVEGTIQTDELYGFAVADGDPLGLISKLNPALAGIRSDGTYDRFIDQWFG
jgi:polar amino acid transport system substrate-binding protein